MSKSIKVSEEVYTELERLRQKRETFSDVVKRLHRAFQTIEQAYERGLGSSGGSPRGREILERGQ